VVFHMSNGAIVTFNDPRRFGYMKLIRRDVLDRDPMIAGLGPEPLGNAFDATMLAAACAGKKTSLKAALSDQKIVAGLGNIYVCEALHRAHLSPKRIASSLALKSGAPHARAQALQFCTQAFINGRYVDAASGERFACVSPVDGRTLTQVASCDALVPSGVALIRPEVFHSDVFGQPA